MLPARRGRERYIHGGHQEQQWATRQRCRKPLAKRLPRFPPARSVARVAGVCDGLGPHRRGAPPVCGARGRSRRFPAGHDRGADAGFTTGGGRAGGSARRRSYGRCREVGHPGARSPRRPDRAAPPRWKCHDRARHAGSIARRSPALLDEIRRHRSGDRGHEGLETRGGDRDRLRWQPSQVGAHQPGIRRGPPADGGGRPAVGLGPVLVSRVAAVLGWQLELVTVSGHAARVRLVLPEPPLP